MRAILSQRPLRFVFAANLISMLGSGMNSAAVAWYILQATHSEQALGTLAVVQTIPAMLMLPFTGVIIDREDPIPDPLPSVTFTRAATLMNSTDDRERLAHAALQAADTLSTHQHPTGGHHG